MKINFNIKTRLTLWYLLATAVILVVFSIVTYVFLSNGLNNITKEPPRLTVITPEFITSQALPSNPPAQPVPLISYTISKEWLQALQSKPVSILSVKTPVGQAEINQKDYLTPDMTGKIQVQLFLQYSTDKTSRPQVVAISQPLSAVSDTLAAFKRVSVYVIPITAVVAAALGFFLVWRMLKPIKTIIKTANEIGEKDLNKRIEVSSPGDELGKLASTLNHSFDKLQNSINRERRFSADASHELRTPLSIMRGETSLALSKTRNAEEYRKSLEAVGVEINKMLSTVNRLLELTRTDSGTEMLKLNRINLRDFLTELTADVEVLGEEKSLRFKLIVTEELQIIGDEVKLRELFLNLLDNAVRYTPEGGRITISLKKENNQAFIAVSDNGIGISAENLPHIFDRFYRVDKTDSRRAGGTGLGLAICKSIADLHGGTIEVESKVNEGSTFTVILPLAGMAK